MKTLTYLVPNDMRREPERPILPEHPVQKLVNEVAEKVAPGLPPPRIVFSGPVFASVADIAAITPEQVERAMQAIAEGDHAAPDVVAIIDRTQEQAARVTAAPGGFYVEIPIKPKAPALSSVLRGDPIYREMVERVADEMRQLLCGSLTDDEDAPGSWALGPVHDGAKVKP